MGDVPTLLFLNCQIIPATIHSSALRQTGSRTDKTDEKQCNKNKQ